MPEFKPEVGSRGYFEIGIYHGKTEANLGTLWRSAYQLGAAGIFTIGQRYTGQASDVFRAYKHIPLRQYKDIDEFLSNRPHDCLLVGVEMGGRELKGYEHPRSAQYLLGAEDHGLPPKIVAKCNHTISLGHVRTASFNVAVAGSIVMYDRAFK